MKKLLMILLLGITACSSQPPQPAAAPNPGLTFIHLNDTYRLGAVEDGSKGGFARVLTVVRELQAQGRDVRFLHAGDFLFPSLESQLWDGAQMVEALNYLDDNAPLYLVPGNHETDKRTPDAIINALKSSRFDWIGDNYRFVTGDAEADALLHSGFTIQYQDKTIGIFSLLLHPDDGGNDRDYVPTENDYLGIAKRSIESFEAQGVDMIFGLTHVLLSTDREIAKLRAEHPKLMFIVGGHEHEPQHSELSADSAEVMKGASNARAIWQIDVEFDATGAASIETRLIPLDDTVAEAADYVEFADSWRKQVLELYPFLEARIGEATLPMDARETVIRSRETSWGNFLADQMRIAFGREPSDLAFINSGTIRIDDFIQGDILFEDIGRTFGFSSFLRHMPISGAEFRNVMEAGFRGDGTGQGYFPQVSGFRVCADISRAEYDRIVSLQVPTDSGWQEIEDDTIYELVVPDFLYGGGDGYSLPSHRQASRRGSELKYLVLDAILRAQGSGKTVGEAVDPGNPRTVVISDASSDCFPR